MNKFIFLAIVFTIFAFATLTMSQESKAEIRKANADDAEALNAKFKTFTVDTPCEPNDTACIGDDFAKCAAVMENGKLVNKYQIQKCNTGLKCFALPLVNSRGTSLVCTTQADHDARIDQARKNLRRRTRV